MYKELEGALDTAAFEAFRRFSKVQAGDSLYCAALYTSSGYSYVCDTANTELGLDELVKESIAQGSERDVLAARAAYKWSPCDWPHHLANEQLFGRANEILEVIWEQARLGSEEDSDRAYIVVHEVFISVLKKIRESAIVPDSCLVTLLAGDQSDEARVVNSEEINSAELVAKFLPDFRVEGDYLLRLRTNRWQQGESFEP